VAQKCGRSQAQEFIDHRVGGRCPEAARHLRKRGEIGEDHRHLHEAALLQVGAACVQQLGLRGLRRMPRHLKITAVKPTSGIPQTGTVGGERRIFGL
jgi:hypothetical protein